MNNYYMIPANSKSGKLIFNIFTKFDLIMVACGCALSLLLLLVFDVGSFKRLFLFLSPMLITLFLVIPIPNYHNVFTVIKELIEFLYKRRNYKWEGWCTSDEYK